MYITLQHNPYGKEAQYWDILANLSEANHHNIIVHPESFRSNAQNANAFARRNRPRVERNDEFACVYLRSRAFACVRLRSFSSTVRDRPRARTRARTYIDMVWAWHYLR